LRTRPALCILGEAARYAPEDVVAARPDIPWQKMAGLRLPQRLRYLEEVAKM